MPSTSQHAPPRRRRRRRSRLGLVLLGLGVIAVAGELFVRFAPLEAFAEKRLVKDWSDTRYEAHPYLAYAPRPNWVDGPPHAPRAVHNSHGFRGPEITYDKPPRTLRVACLGGSSTYGHGPSSNAATWPQQLRDRLAARLPSLEVEVLNAGTSGYSSYESLINLALRVVEYEPDLVLVYHSINDVRLWRWPDIQPDNTHWRAVWPVVERSPITEWLERSRLFLFLRATFTDAASEDLGHWVINGYGEKDMIQWTIQPAGPPLFERNLEHLVALCRANRIRVVFGLQAYFRDDLTNDADRGGMKVAASVLRRVGERLGVSVADVDGGVPQRRELFTNDVHVTDPGARAIADAWAEHLRSTGMLAELAQRIAR